MNRVKINLFNAPQLVLRQFLPREIEIEEGNFDCVQNARIVQRTRMY